MTDQDWLQDLELQAVADALASLDPIGVRFARVFRETFDQLYDGQRTGRYKWDQLFKTEKTHFGTLIEINLQREFRFEDGDVLDYKISGTDVDCKYSFRDGGWMLPPESWGRLILVATANDESSLWSVGVVRVLDHFRRGGVNRDGKSGLNQEGRQGILWVFRNAEFPPNVLLQLSPEQIEAIEAKKSGQQKLDELFRQAEGLRIHRNAVATVARQMDYMKRVRSNGGSRSNMRPEGYVIPSGDYASHRAVAQSLGGPVPEPGEFVSFRLVPTSAVDPVAVELGGSYWRRAREGDAVAGPGPVLPKA